MAFSEYLNIHYCIWYLVFILFNDFNPNNVQYFETFSDLGAVHKRRHQLGGGEGSKIGQNCRRIVLKNCRHGGGGCQKSRKNCRRRLWMVPKSNICFRLVFTSNLIRFWTIKIWYSLKNTQTHCAKEQHQRKPWIMWLCCPLHTM